MWKPTLLAQVLQLSNFVYAQTGDAPIVDLGYAKYQGVFNDTTNVTSFMGIRYAAAPVGDLRWRAPTPPPNVTDIQHADTPAPQCYQSPWGANPRSPFPPAAGRNLTKRVPSGTNEDCLFLSVYYPGESAPAEKLPVIFWIHGGGYIGGDISGYYGGDIISQSKGGVVVVTVQYRLGLFGFLAGNEVHANGTSNAGLLDQNFALRWVNKHISKFGGDPEQVTIWGQSAGGGSVLQHVIAEDGETSPQLFRGAIASSPFLPSQYAYNDTIPQALYNQVVDAVNCKSSQDTLECLRKADISALESANEKINLNALFALFAFIPVVDGTFIRQRPTQALKGGKVNGKALLAFYNADEGLLFVNQTAPPLNASQYAAELFPKLTSQDVATVAKLYAGLGSDLQQENLIVGEAMFVCPSHFLANGFDARSTYMGEFAVPPATHAQDVIYYFTSYLTLSPSPLPLPEVFNNTDFVNAFAQSFVSFAISLDPNVKVDPSSITPQWDLYDGSAKKMVFNKTVDDLPDIRLVETNKDLLTRCNLWESLNARTEQ
ncbi:hypothetical protein AAF712_007218 [Marasmius tenuissimus]|uniref:Carboxylic ester hydrolase n=1 Tax=Marasmius tenuissimus TaxID=585030 RepID=A0ABR2ZWP2_9AGAR|nr:hypothetical protein PM082_009005 [Marasmius tenuissimus]